MVPNNSTSSKDIDDYAEMDKALLLLLVVEWLVDVHLIQLILF
jgi:hypothetical protein